MQRAVTPDSCHSSNRAESPEWRRGPDGTRTLCNACGLHYAKTSRKVGQKQVPKSSSPLRQSMSIPATALSSPTVRKILFQTQDTGSSTQSDRILLLEKELEEKNKRIQELQHHFLNELDSNVLPGNLVDG
jgi:hypothetical protein